MLPCGQQQLQQQLKDLYAQRDAAVRRSGSGAAAPYNAAIAKIEQAIAEVQAQQVLVPQLYGDVSAGIQAGYGAAAEKIKGNAEMQKVYHEQIGEQARSADRYCIF